MNFKTYFILFIILLNIIAIFGISAGKLYYKKETDVNLIANFTISIGIFFILYTLCLILFSAYLFYECNYLFASVILALSTVPFVIGEISSYKKADFFINLQIIALLVNLFIIGLAK